MTFLIGSLLLSWLPAGARAAGGCPLLGTPQVSPVLVSLENRTAENSYRRGERIHVMLTLRAGAQGVYLPDFYGSFLQTCSHGFAAEILTLDGRGADPKISGCGHSGPSPKVTYKELRAGETRTWSTDLATKSIAPGRYCLYAEYLSFKDLSSAGLGLPEDQTLVAAGRITATPLEIRISRSSTR